MLNDDGKYFISEKIDQLVEFSRPTTSVQLKSFRGLAYYFHTQIRNLSTITTPLENRIANYTKKVAKTSILRNSETVTTYKNVVLSNSNCPIFSFIG
jgi:hypothetical protein